MKVLIVILFICKSATAAYTAKDFKQEITSPWSHHVNNVFWSGTALTLLAVVVKDQTDDIEKEAVEDKPLGDFSKFGDLAGKLYPNYAYIIGQLIAGAAGNKKGVNRALGMGKATLYASTTTLVLKKIIREPRPDDNSQRDSFPSAHSTHAFAFGGYVFAQHGWQWGVPALAISTFSAASRINDNRHRLQDVIGGATIGLSYGLGLGWLNLKQEVDDEDDSSASFFIAPIWEGDIKGLALTGQF